MLKVGITGGIGSGKSTIAKIFETLGIPVYYADAAAKKLMNEDEALKQNIIAAFGNDAYKNGQLNRQFIADVVFNNPEKLQQLNALTHPATIAAAEEWMKKQITKYALKEAALIFESDAHKHLDYVIGISAPVELRLHRTMQRDGISQEDVLARMARQMNEEEKIKRCDFIIVNDEQQLVLPQVLALHEKLLSI